MLKPNQLKHLFYQMTDDIQPDCYVEVGAFRAESSIDISQKSYKPKVFAYEANPYTYNAFNSTITQYPIEYKNIAITDYTGKAIFYIQQNYPEVGNNSISKRNSNAKYDEVEIDCDTLDNQLKDITGKIVLWIDAEGKGFEVLKGASNILKQVELILIEVEQYPFWQNQALDNEVKDFLKEQGFKIVNRDAEWPRQYNILFSK